MMSFCRNCGVPLLDDWAYCNQCGVSVVESSQNSNQITPKKEMSTIKIVLLSVLGAIGLLMVKVILKLLFN